MLVPDVNVLVAAFVAGDARQRDRRAWLTRLVNGPTAYGMSELVLSGFLRITTNERVFGPDPSGAFAFIEAVTRSRHCTRLRPGPNHWPIFLSLCRATGYRGPVLSDLYHAALAIEHGCEWVSDDRDFGRIPGLAWRQLS